MVGMNEPFPPSRHSERTTSISDLEREVSSEQALEHSLKGEEGGEGGGGSCGKGDDTAPGGAGDAPVTVNARRKPRCSLAQ